MGLTARSSTFDRRHVIQHLIDHLPPGLPSSWFESTADRYLDRSEVVKVGVDQVKGDCFSTVELLALERRLADQVTTRMNGHPWLEVLPSITWSVFQERPSLSDEQRDLIGDVCRLADGVSVIVAGPGTGKTFCLDAIRDAYQRSGFTVTGCALSASAAHQLEQGSGIRSTTIARLQLDLTNRRQKLDARTVLVIDEAPHLRVVVLLAGFAGLRRGELFGLRRGDVDLDAGELSVQRQAVYLDDGTRLETKPKSEAGVRTVSLPPFVIDALRDHLYRWTPAGEATSVFVGERGGPLGPVSLQTCFDEARVTTGLTQFTLHDLRHAAGTMAKVSDVATKASFDMVCDRCPIREKGFWPIAAAG